MHRGCLWVRERGDVRWKEEGDKSLDECYKDQLSSLSLFCWPSLSISSVRVVKEAWKGQRLNVSWQLKLDREKFWEKELREKEKQGEEKAIAILDKDELDRKIQNWDHFTNTDTLSWTSWLDKKTYTMKRQINKDRHYIVFKTKHTQFDKLVGQEERHNTVIDQERQTYPIELAGRTRKKTQYSDRQKKIQTYSVGWTNWTYKMKDTVQWQINKDRQTGLDELEWQEERLNSVTDQ